MITFRVLRKNQSIFCRSGAGITQCHSFTEGFSLKKYLMKVAAVMLSAHAKQQNHYRLAYAAGSPLPVSRKARTCNMYPPIAIIFPTVNTIIQASAAKV